MPHCNNGHELRVGDRVMVECVVEGVYQTEGENFCNVNLRTVLHMPPYETGSTFTANTRQTTKIIDEVA